MASGPWEDYQTSDQKQGPWSDYQTSGTPDQFSAGRAFSEKLGDAATLNYMPQLEAGIAKIAAPIHDAFYPDEKVGATLPSYVQMRDQKISDLAQMAKEHPYASAAGTLTGIVGSGAALAGGALAKGASGAMKAANAAKSGALIGAVMNPGDTQGEVDPFQVGDRTKNAAIGAAFGVAGEGAAAGLGYGAQKLGDAFENSGARQAFKALGPYARDAKKAYAKGQVETIGKELLGSGALNGLPSTEAIAQRAGAAKEEAGQAIGNIITDLDQKASNLTGAGNPNAVAVPGAKAATAAVDRHAIADSLEKHLLVDATDNDIPGIAKQNDYFKNMIDKFRQGGQMGLKAAQDLKVKLNGMIKWDRLPGADIPQDEQFYRSLYGKMNQAVDDGADVLAQAVGTDSTKQALQAAKTRFGAMAEAQKIANNRSASEIAKRMISPSDYLSGGAGLIAGVASGDSLEDKVRNGAIGLALGGANNFGRKYGNQILAKSLTGIATQLARVPEYAALADKNPTAFQRLVQGVAQHFGSSGEAIPQMADSPSDPNRKPVGHYAEGGEVKTLGEIIGYPGGPKPKPDPKNYARGSGPIPGHAKVAGNSLKNDTVPAMLSPGEIVLPRSVTMHENAAEEAAKFVAAHLAKSAKATGKVKHGTIKDGRIFYGGDASNPKNWKKLK